VAGIPHERLIGYHRVHAWALYAVFFAHMVCMSIAMRTRINGYPIVRQINDKMDVFKVNPQLGIAAFILWSWLMFTSFDYFRRKAWGMWYLNHFTFFPAVLLTLFHNRPVLLPWSAAAAGFFYVDAGIRGYMKFMRKSEVKEASVLPGGVAKLVVSTGDNMVYEPGQYVWIAFALKDGPEALQSLSFHPYSISSAHAPGDKTYTLHIKNMGPGSWSEAVEKAAAGGAEAFKGGCRVGGPSGRFSIEPSHFERIVLVAGGIGFTPLVSLLADIVRDAAGDGKEGARHYASVRHVTVLWAVQSGPCLTWFADQLDAARAASNVTVDLQLFVTRGAKDAEQPGAFKTGRPDVTATLAGAAAQKGAGAVGVYACGPAQMLEDTRDAVAAANAKADDLSSRFLLHTEVFLF